MAEAVFNIRSVGRKLPDWVDAWVQYTEEMGSPEIWRRWGGIALIAGALERRVYLQSKKGFLFPHLYTILVGPPGVGKTVITSQISAMWRELEGLHTGSSSLTHASLADELGEAKRHVFADKMELLPEFHSLAICSNELAVLLPEYDNNFMNRLTDIYDGFPFSERRRSIKERLVIERPQINFIAATTPGYLTNFLPEAAWDQGFLSRTMLIFSAERPVTSIFGETHYSEELRKDLVKDLTQIFSLQGKILFTPEAAEKIEEWNRQGCPPIPDHPKLLNYNTRRVAHALKLSMIACISAGQSLVITAEHFQTALDWLLEMEHFIPDIFKSMVIGGDRKAIDETWYHAAMIYAKEKAPVKESRLIEFLSERVPSMSVMRILDLMVKGTILKEETLPFEGRAFIPRARRPGS